MGAFGLTGIVLVVATAGRLARQPSARPPTTWGGLLDPVNLDRTSMLPAALLAGVALTLFAWWRAYALAGGGRLSVRQAAALLAVWAVPLTLGPPILSLDVYSYAAHGLMLATGLDPYRYAPAVLPHGSPQLAAVDPMWRSSLAPYGPLAMAIFRAADEIAGGSLLGVVVLLRVLTLAGVALMAVSVAGAAPAARRAEALTAAALNPIVLFQVLGAVHLEAVMMGLLAAGLLAIRRDHPILGLLMLTAAAAVKWPALLAVVAAVVWHATRPATARRVAFTLTRDVALVTIVGLGSAALVPDGFGWLHAAATPTTDPTGYSPTVIMAGLLGRYAVPVGAAAAAVIILWLFVTIRSRDLTATTGWALLALAAFGPVLHPWYLVWGLVPLAIVPTRRQRGTILAVTAAGVFLAIQHCSLLLADRPEALEWLRGHASIVAVTGYGAAAAVVMALQRRSPRPLR